MQKKSLTGKILTLLQKNSAMAKKGYSIKFAYVVSTRDVEAVKFLMLPLPAHLEVLTSEFASASSLFL